MKAFNYKRKIPSLKGAYVPRLVIPKKLPCHSIIIISQVNMDETQLPFLIAKHIVEHMKKVAYIHRLHDESLIRRSEGRWQGGDYDTF